MAAQRQIQTVYDILHDGQKNVLQFMNFILNTKSLRLIVNLCCLSN